MAPPPSLCRALATPALALLVALVLALPSSAQSRAVVAFGDSVTKGFVPSADANIPYTIELERLLRLKFGAGARVVNANSGAAALLPAPKKAAMSPTVYSTLASSTYQTAIFMVGTNDILMGQRQSADVIAALRPLVDAALAKGSTVLLLSMPPTAISTPAQERERQQLNAAEKSLAREYRGRGNAVTAVDLEDGLFARLGGGFRPNARAVLEDGVHLCRTCYAELGQIVFKAMGAVDGWCRGGRGKRGAAVISASQARRFNC